MPLPLVPGTHLEARPDPGRRFRLLEIVRLKMRDRRFSDRTQRAYIQLAGAVLGPKLDDAHALERQHRLHAGQQVVVGVDAVHGIHRKGVDRADRPLVVPPVQGELRLERDPRAEAALPQPGQRGLKPPARASLPDGAVLCAEVAENPPNAWPVWDR